MHVGIFRHHIPFLLGVDIFSLDSCSTLIFWPFLIFVIKDSLFPQYSAVISFGTLTYWQWQLFSCLFSASLNDFASKFAHFAVDNFVFHILSSEIAITHVC
jgi:hypothetical protein